MPKGRDKPNKPPYEEERERFLKGTEAASKSAESSMKEYRTKGAKGKGGVAHAAHGKGGGKHVASKGAPPQAGNRDGGKIGTLAPKTGTDRHEETMSPAQLGTSDGKSAVEVSRKPASGDLMHKAYIKDHNATPSHGVKGDGETATKKQKTEGGYQQKTPMAPVCMDATQAARTWFGASIMSARSLEEKVLDMAAAEGINDPGFESKRKRSAHSGQPPLIADAHKGLWMYHSRYEVIGNDSYSTLAQLVGHLARGWCWVLAHRPNSPGSSSPYNWASVLGPDDEVPMSVPIPELGARSTLRALETFNFSACLITVTLDAGSSSIKAGSEALKEVIRLTRSKSDTLETPQGIGGEKAQGEIGRAHV